ncbi:tRNA dimethylallyltransferase [Candidatus Providencia siddallii]|uniref:tRNA dimethylallyltransferase n=1 Tax=Candidatus Providencia siddallii TaxID=1715285 RepID=A0A0M6W7A4_9GAMM|nr:tRNA dimethylallyltransferase [Candidatus Providencia siddallii]
MNKLIQNKQVIIFLFGPTASGKTSFVIDLCKIFPIEIISVDSALIYRDMDIGTNKPDHKQLRKIPHYLIDIIDPSNYYSAANFCRDALSAIEKILLKGKIPLLVGGTMLYFKSLLYGLSPLPSSDINIRTKIKQIIHTQGLPEIYHRLSKIDSVSAARIHPNDSQRLIRALEIYLISGYTLTELIKKTGKKLQYNVLQFAISPLERKYLYNRIEKRFYIMLDSGFENEVKALYKRNDLHIDLPSIRCVGYRQMWLYLNGKINYDEMIRRGIYATKQLAKRQITWLKNWKNIYLLNSENIDQSLNAVIRQINQNIK